MLSPSDSARTLVVRSRVRFRISVFDSLPQRNNFGPVRPFQIIQDTSHLLSESQRLQMVLRPLQFADQSILHGRHDSPHLAVAIQVRRLFANEPLPFEADVSQPFLQRSPSPGPPVENLKDHRRELAGGTLWFLAELRESRRHHVRP